MPTRRAKKCGIKANVSLDLISELNLVTWRPMIPGTDFANVDELARTWALHGEQILANVRRCLPGTRPSACYKLGLIPLPEPNNQPQPDDVVEVWGSVKVYPAWRHFGAATGSHGHYHAGLRWGECQHLKRLGLLSKEELAEARTWVDDRYYDPSAIPRRYEPISKDLA